MGTATDTSSRPDILAIIEEEERLWESSLQSDREDALRRYRGDPYGDEQEGLSQVVSHDVADVVNWMMPQLIKLFMSGDEIVSFAPRGPEDVAQAEQETAYLNHVLLDKHANAFETIYAWIQDGLIQKNGYCKAWWSEDEDVSEESYEGLAPEELQMLASYPTFEVTEVEQDEDEPGVVEVKGRRRNTYGCVKYAGIAPENVIVSSRATCVRPGESDFVEHWEYKSLSQLRAEGYDVPDDIADDSNTLDVETQTRDKYGLGDENDRPAALRRVKVRECWLNYDQDGDGIAELRKVVVIGSEILENETTDVVPIAAWTPYIEAHQHTGQSVADQIMDLQRIKTSLTRVMIDGLYLQTHGRWAVTDRVNLDDMLISRPNGIVRVDGALTDALMPLVQSPTSPIAINGIQYIDSVKYERTGMNPASVGVDQNALNPTNTATGIISLQNAAQERVLLIARAFAEMGLRDLFSIAHALTLKHSRQADIVRLRGEWVPVDPRQWRERRDMSINVGLGTGNKDQQLMQLNAILQYQMQLLPLGITKPENIYNAMRKLIHNAGFKQPEEFVTDPKTAQPAGPPPPDPKLQVEMAKIQDNQQRGQAEMMLETQKAQRDAMLEEQRIALERYKAELDAQTKKELAVMQMANDAELERARMQHSTQLEQTKLKLSHQYKVRENNKAIQDENYDADAEEQLARAKMEVLAQIMNEIRGLSQEFEAGRPEAITPVRDQRGRVIGGQIRSANGAVRNIQIQ